MDFSTAMLNGLAVLALVGMLAISALSLWRWRQQTWMLLPRVWWQIPLVALLGVGVMGVLVYLGTRPETAVCLPRHDCAILQESRFAWPLGIPVGVWGAGAYVAIIAAWGLVQFGNWLGRRVGFVLLLLTAFGGQLFAIYFTFLEPFVIGKTCAWCLVAAVIMSVLFWYSVEVLQGVRLMRELNR